MEKKWFDYIARTRCLLDPIATYSCAFLRDLSVILARTRKPSSRFLVRGDSRSSITIMQNRVADRWRMILKYSSW